MSLSFSGLTSYGKFSLHDVSYPTIQRDGPQGRFTYYRQKVGDRPAAADSLVDRADDSIMKVARAGVIGSGTDQALFYTQFNGKLPYRILDKGEFRPEVVAPTDLLPLSKQRRGNTKIEPTYCLPGNIDRNINKERGNKSAVLSCSAQAAVTYHPQKHQRERDTDRQIKPTFVIEHTGQVGGATKVLLPESIGAGARDHVAHITVEGFKQFPAGKEQHDRDTTAHIKSQLAGSMRTNFEGPQKFTIPAADFYRTNDRLQVAVGAGQRALPKYNQTESTVAHLTRDAFNVGASANIGYSTSKVFHPEINTRARQEPVRASAHTALHKQFSGGPQTQHFDTQVSVKGRAGILLPHNNF